MLKLLTIINKTAVENPTLSNEIIQKMSKSFAKSLAGVTFDNLNGKYNKSC